MNHPDWRRVFTRLAIVAIAALGLAGCAAVDEPAYYEEHRQFLAGDEGRFTRSGTYLGFGYTAGFDDFDVAGTSVDRSNGLFARFGFRGSRYMGLEASFADHLNFDSSPDTTATPAGPVDAYEARVLTINTRLYPLGFLEGNAARIQPYATLGAGLMWIRAKSPGHVAGVPGNASNSSVEQSAALRYGLGLEVYLAEHLHLLGEYSFVEPLASRLDDFPLREASFGLEYRF
ncbi:MAG: outer membrane beta-barrel protein [Planctomycetes bacterium]|nr:outer membrane beta-barrel protein [Planctomycetota bacterium]